MRAARCVFTYEACGARDGVLLTGKGIAFPATERTHLFEKNSGPNKPSCTHIYCIQRRRSYLIFGHPYRIYIFLNLFPFEKLFVCVWVYICIRKYYINCCGRQNFMRRQHFSVGEKSHTRKCVLNGDGDGGGDDDTTNTPGNVILRFNKNNKNSVATTTRLFFLSLSLSRFVILQHIDVHTFTHICALTHSHAYMKKSSPKQQRLYWFCRPK